MAYEGGRSEASGLAQAESQEDSVILSNRQLQFLQKRKL